MAPAGCDPFLWRLVGCALCFCGAGLVMTAGMVAGLTMGYVSLDMTYLAILKKTGTKAQQKQ